METAIKIGIFGARADNGGLGVQTWEWYKHIKPAKTLIMDISALNGNANHYERYNGDPGVSVYATMQGAPELVTKAEIDDFLTGLDLVLCFEIPYNYYLFKAARERGVKTVLNYNYEFLDYLNRPYLPMPDLLLAPSPWHFEEVKNKFGKYTRVEYLPVPVNREVLPFRNIKKAKVFNHVAGHELFEDRNGTKIVLDAIKHIQSEVTINIFTQHAISNAIMPHHVTIDPRVNILHNDVLNYWDVYKHGDVHILPRRYGGLSLQLAEAMSCGMIPIMTNVEPQSGFLHPLTLINPDNSKTVETRTAIDCYSVDPVMLAAKIDFLAEASPETIKTLNEYSNQYAESISWPVLLPKYKALFESLK